MSAVVVFFVSACFFTAVVSSAVAFVLWQRRSTPGAFSLALLMTAMTEWAIAVAIEALFTDAALKILWSKIAYLGIASAPPLFLLFMLQYTRQEQWMTRRNIVLLFVLPIMTISIAWTNEWHHLLWNTLIPSATDPNVLIYGHGPWFWIAATYSYIMLATGTLVLVRAFLNPHSLFRQQVGWLLLSIAVSIIWNAVYLTGTSPIPGWDLTPIAFSISSWILAWTILRWRLFDLVPVARDVLIENISDGVLVIDSHHRIVDVNPAVLRMINQSAEALIGQDPTDVFASNNDLVKRFRNVFEGASEIVVDGDTPRYLDIRISPLRDQQGNLTGKVIVLRDITERKQVAQEINQRLVELGTINDVSQVVASQIELNAMIKMTGEKARQILNAHGILISLYDSQTKTISTPYWRSYDDFIVAPTISLGQGLTSWIIRTRQPLVINQDYERRSTELGVVRIVHPSLGLPKSWLGVPMIVGDQVVGIISAQNYEHENIFTENDVRLWTTIAANVGIAIRNAQLYSETHRYAEQMAALNRISLAITEGLAMERLLPALHKQCQQIAPIDVFYVALYNEGTHQRQVVYFDDRGEPRTTPISDIRVAPGLTGYIIQTRQTLYLPDTLDSNNPPPVPLIRVGGPPSRTFVGVPLILRDHVIGVISMQSYQPNAYSTQQIHMLEMVAVQAAIAISNAQLFGQVQRLAVTDDLTGLLNRRVLFERGADEVNRAKRFGRPLAAAMLDIDHFKIVNDTYLHAAGDRVLQSIAIAFRKYLRNTDLAARYGGEEFGLLLPETESTVALQVVKRLRDQIANTDISIRQGRIIRVTLSAGVAILDAETNSFDELIDCADRALYYAKQSGRNRAILWSKDLK